MSRFLIFSGYNERAVVALCRELTALARPFSIIASSGRDPIFRTTYRSHVAAIRAVTALDADDLDRCLRNVQAAHPGNRWVIAPSSEFLNQHVLTHRAWFAARQCEIPLVDASCYSRVTNKLSFRALCEEAGIAVPTLVEPNAGACPFVAKPRTNISRDGRSLYPALIYSADDWARQRDGLGSLDDYYFEALVTGSSHYLLYYLPTDPSAPVFSWSQRNLLQQPNGKSMLMAVSDTLHTAPISDQVVEMLRGVGFHGLAMVEVIRHHDEYVAIELNPRLWGPLQLVRNAGTHLIRAFIEDALDGRITTADPAAGHPASYLWLGGVRAGMTWHCPPPRFPWLWLTPRLGGDVYLQRDTMGLFIDECVRRAA
jgi:predicted ATP-grasp superfamily ATP-dependent carboligase